MNIVRHYTIIAKFKRFVITLKWKAFNNFFDKTFLFHATSILTIKIQNFQINDTNWKKLFLRHWERERDWFKTFLSKMNKFEFTIYPNYSEKEVSLCAQNVFEKDLIIQKQNGKNICQSYTVHVYTDQLCKIEERPVCFCCLLPTSPCFLQPSGIHLHRNPFDQLL